MERFNIKDMETYLVENMNALRILAKQHKMEFSDIICKSIDDEDLTDIEKEIIFSVNKLYEIANDYNINHTWIHTESAKSYDDFCKFISDFENDDFLDNTIPDLPGEIYDILKKYAEKDDQYINPHFLSIISDALTDYYQIDDEKVDDWIHSMLSR